MKTGRFQILGYAVFLTLAFFAEDLVKWIDNGRGCRKQQEYYIQVYAFNGIVEQKYYDDKNHRANTLSVLEKGQLKDFVFEGNNNGFYRFVGVEDSVLKRKNCDTIYVVRNDSVHWFIIDLKCDP